MSYQLILSDLAKEHLTYLKQTDSSAFEKARSLLHELEEHPRTGTGKPEFLKHLKQWSRRINHKHRMVYTIGSDAVVVVSVIGHY